MYSKTPHGMCSYAYLKISSTNKHIGPKQSWTQDPGPGSQEPVPDLQARRLGPNSGTQTWGPGQRTRAADPDPVPNWLPIGPMKNQEIKTNT